MIEVLKNCAKTTFVIREAFLSVKELCLSRPVKNLVEKEMTKLTREIVMETRMAISLDTVETSPASAALCLSL